MPTQKDRSRNQGKQGEKNHSTELGALTSSKSNISLISWSPPTHPQLLLGDDLNMTGIRAFPLLVCNVVGVKHMDCLVAILRGTRGPGEDSLLSGVGGKAGASLQSSVDSCRGNGMHVLHNLHAPSSFLFFCWVRLHKPTCHKQLCAHVIFGEWDFYFPATWFVDLPVVHLDLFDYYFFAPTHGCRNNT